MPKKLTITLALISAFALIFAACGSSGGDDDSSAADSSAGSSTGSSSESSLLDRVRDRDRVICGARDALPGFAVIDGSGNETGFDVEFCRVVAAAVLGDADKVEIKPLMTSDRFTSLQSGEIDVLIRNTTWTASRDGDLASNFLFTTFYDGQGIMVPDSSSVRTLTDLDGATICVASGTTTEQNLASFFAQRRIDYNPRSFDEVTELRAAYEAGQCEAWTGDRSSLTGFKSTIEGEGGPAQRILSDTISKEPLGPLVLDGDTRWAQAVNWAVMSTVLAWELGINSDNVDALAASNNNGDANINSFLGKSADGSGSFNPGLGLSDDFAVNVISQVGNYQEIYNRNIAPLGLPLVNSLNSLWTSGGLLYVPPYR